MKKYVPDLHGWALDAGGKPVPVGMALEKAKGYTCPICKGRMRVRTKQNKHYFYHESVENCSAASVADLLGGKWLMHTCQEMIQKNVPLRVTWSTSDESYHADLLYGVASVVENYSTQYGMADLALLDSDGHLQAVICWQTLDENDWYSFSYHGIPLIVVKPETFYSGMVNSGFVFTSADIIGGWWLQKQEDFSSNLIVNPETIRSLFQQMVGEVPFAFYEALETVDTHRYVLRYREHLVWLPYEMFELVIGGTRSPIRSIVILKQKWEEKDKSVIEIFYITRARRDGGKEHAVAVRRHFPQLFDAPRSTISLQALNPNASAKEIARELATQ